HAVVVGHYQGDTIISAEAQIDRQLGGRLTRRQALGLYPGPLNTSETLSGEGAFPGALVVGLGKVGELKAGLLTETFARALVAHALNRLESLEISARGAVAEVTLSILLIGTTAAGLTIRDAADALLRGVWHANQRLQQARLADRVRIAAVEFIELYRDRAIEAARVLADVVRDPELEREFDLAREVETSDGGRYRVAFEQATGWWDRLQILEENGQLKITALTDRARAEVSILPTQRSLIDQFIGQAIGSTRSDERIASTLFELLWPNDLKPFARERRDLVLVVNDAAAAYPWELMHDGLSGAAEGAATDEFHAPLAVQAGMIRQREAPDHRARIMGPVSNTALVVGDPDLAYPLGVANELALSQLPGARDEAETVRALLQTHAYETSAVIHETSDAIVRELFARPYRILHLAGHGLYRFSPGGGPASGDRSSAALGDRAYGASPGAVVPAAAPDQPMTGMLIGNLVFLTPAEIEQMRYVPDLVFINCCFSGMDQTGRAPARRDRHRLAANISTQLIRMGVRAVVAAGWAVDDGAARTFAEEFYRRMLGGERFGRAVQAARKRAYADHPGVNTWGAYQCYGDPDFRLITEAADGERSGGGLAFFTPDELIAELDNLRQDALASDGPETADRLRARLKALESRIPVAWRKAGGVCAALGQAHGEIDDFERAIQCYEDALKAEGANVPVRAIEQLANLKARWAVSLHQHSPRATRAVPDPDALVAEALGHLDLLIALAPTAERLSLKGSAFKRKAWLAGDVAARRLALEAMRDAYEKGAAATAVPADQRTPRDYYAHTNALTARFILGLHGQDGGALPADARALFDEIAASEERRAGREGDFWSHSARGDCLSLDHMIVGDLASHVEAVVGAYREARQRASSPRQWKSILEHYDFLIEMAGHAGQGQLVAALGRIRTALADD
ncbi:MAG TPA: CHAT domain-containing protein, partial [Candidatus Binatia bacterium]|nr:CHAT domain-containing protein [Candidatus Binatia bacterium]